MTEPTRVRADKQRNRDTLLATARAAFAAGEGRVAMEDVARRAGVGVGTLYRHFPTREALVEAVYAAEIDDVTGSITALLDQHPPADALRHWLVRYAAFVTTKRGMMDTLRAGVASGRVPAVRDRVAAVIDEVFARGSATGAFRGDVEPDDVTTMLHGVFLATSVSDRPERIDRLLDLVVDAAVAGTPATGATRQRIGRRESGYPVSGRLTKGGSYAVPANGDVP